MVRSNIICRSIKGHRSLSIWMISIFIISIFIPILSPVGFVKAETDPGVGTYFKYDYYEDISQCTGAYEGYDEDTDGEGTYRVTGWENGTATVDYSWWWKYDDTEGKRKKDNQQGQITYNTTSRMYTSSHFDLDEPEYRGIPTTDMAVWFSIPTDVEKDDELRILHNYWTVTNTDKTLWSKGVPRKVIEVTFKSSDYRNDDYGKFSYHYEDRLYFEKNTGFFFAERYEEWDTGTWEGDSASFKITIKLDVTESSYSVEINWFAMIVVYSLIILGSISLICLTYLFIKWARWRKRTALIKDITKMHSGKGPSNKVEVFRVRKMSDFPHMRNNATEYFGPFLEHWTRKCLEANDTVAVALNKNLGIVGYGMLNREAKIGTILCRNSEMTEMIRVFLRAKDFFSEVKHTMKASKMSALDSIRSNNRSEKDIYNIFEEHTVYTLGPIPFGNYDTELIRPMAETDLEDVAKLAKEIYRTKSKKWVTSSYNSGDIGFVAEMDGRIVGFAFAEVCGEWGRIHTLSVKKEFRGRGIAKELFNARLEALRQLGIDAVLDEIADWNLASIRIATVAGFKPIGKMYVETARSKRVKRDIIRR